MTEQCFFTGKIRRSGNADVITVPTEYKQQNMLSRGDRVIVMPVRIPEYLSNEYVHDLEIPKLQMKLNDQTIEITKHEDRKINPGVITESIKGATRTEIHELDETDES